LSDISRATRRICNMQCSNVYVWLLLSLCLQGALSITSQEVTSQEATKPQPGSSDLGTDPAAEQLTTWIRAHGGQVCTAFNSASQECAVKAGKHAHPNPF